MKLIVHVPANKLSHPLLKALLLRKDGVYQHYSRAPVETGEDTSHGVHPSQLPPPTRRRHPPQWHTQHLRSTLSFLAKHHPCPQGRPEVEIAETDAKLRSLCDDLDADYMVAVRTEAFYIAPKHVIVITPKLCKLLTHPQEQFQTAGMRYIVHEWYHAMRREDVLVYTPVEEGAAELFTNRVFLQMTGVPGELRNIETYKPWQDGLRLLGNRLYGEGNALAWARQSRTVPSQTAWFFGELNKLQFNLVSIFRLTEYNDDTKAREWLTTVKAGLKGVS